MKNHILKIMIGLILLGSTAMATDDWILSQPVQTDTTNYEWVLGSPYVVTEEAVVAGFNMWFIRDNKKGGKL